MADKPFLDFAAIKAAISIEQVVTMLGLSMTTKGDQWRGKCPACKAGGDRALAVNTAKASYFCFSEGRGGDQIGLCAHIRGVGQRDAAQEIAAHFRIGESQQTTASPGTVKVSPNDGGMKQLDYLEHEHDAVQVLGFEPEVAEALGIGFAAKGVLRGFVAIPIRLSDGTLCGYVGTTDLKLPPKWQGLPASNVVPLQVKKPA